ncbi:MAG: hypothetical protein J6O41_00300 [Clostridia bacterium]|nr:hypothetical protein [Clostridia bacterium]
MNYEYTYNLGNTAASDSTIISILASMGIAYWIILLAIEVVMIVSMWKIFEKAGKAGWIALIPFYNAWTLFEIGGQKGAYIFFALIPCAGLIIYLVVEIKAYLEIAKRFGKDTAFGVLSIFFPFVTFPILAFSDAKYSEGTAEKKTSILDVDLAGVPESNERTFDYGYEKEDTIVMNPVEEGNDTKSTEEEKK